MGGSLLRHNPLTLTLLLDIPDCLVALKGLRGEVSVKSKFFKELTPRLWTYELRGQGKKKAQSESKTNKHLTLSYKNYLQKWHLPS